MTKKILMISLVALLFCGQAYVYATEMPEEVIGASLDDGYETDVGGCVGDANYICMKYTTGCSLGFYRFTSIPIAQGATIDACTMFVDVYNSANDDPNVDIYCEDTSSATTITVGLNCIAERTQTSASVTWEATGIGAGYQPSPELKTIVQEIISRGDWSSGNDLAFIFVAKSGSVFYTDSYDVGQPAKLHCWYTSDGEPAEASPRRRMIPIIIEGGE